MLYADVLSTIEYQNGFEFALIACAAACLFGVFAFVDGEDDSSQNRDLATSFDDIARLFAELSSALADRESRREEEKNASLDSRAVDPQRSSMRTNYYGVDPRRDEFVYDDPLDADLFATDSDEDDEDDDKTRDEDDADSRRFGNFRGAFFKNRYNPRDASDDQGGGADKKRDGARENTNDDSDRDSADLFQDDDALDEEVFYDESISPRQKIEKLRRRLEDGNETARRPLIGSLIEFVGEASADEEEEALRALQEASELTDEEDANDPFDSERFELRAQIAITRVVFYLKNDLKPPLDAIGNAPKETARWVDAADSEESKRALARAYLVQGRALFALGADAPALAAYRRAIDVLDEFDSYENDEELDSSLGFAYACVGETNRMIGDVDGAIAAFRTALNYFNKRAERELFLSERANVSIVLSELERDRGAVAEADDLLQKALEAEERLFSFDEERYFAPLVHILLVKATLQSRSDDSVEAFAAIDRAIGIVKTILAADSKLESKNVAHLLSAEAHAQRAYLKASLARATGAAADSVVGLRDLIQYVNKDDSSGGAKQMGELFSISCETAFLADEPDRAVQILRAASPCFSRFFDDERAPQRLSSSLVLLHGQLFQHGRSDEAGEALNLAVETLRDACARSATPERKNAYARALFQRCAFEIIVMDDPEAAALDMDESSKLFEELRREGELSAESTMCLIDVMTRRAYALSAEKEDRLSAILSIPEDDAQNSERRRPLADERQTRAYEDLKNASSLVVENLCQRDWRFAPVAARVAQGGLAWLISFDSLAQTLRVARLWLSFARRLRKRFFESDWEADANDDDSESTRAALDGLERLALCARFFRASAVMRREWRADARRFLPIDEATRRLDAVSAATSRDAFLCPAVERGEFLDERAKFLSLDSDLGLRRLAIWNDLSFFARSLERRILDGDDSVDDLWTLCLAEIVEFYRVSGALKLAVGELEELAEPFKRALADRFPKLAFLIDGSPSTVATPSQCLEGADALEDAATRPAVVTAANAIFDALAEVYESLATPNQEPTIAADYSSIFSNDDLDDSFPRAFQYEGAANLSSASSFEEPSLFNGLSFERSDQTTQYRALSERSRLLAAFSARFFPKDDAIKFSYFTARVFEYAEILASHNRLNVACQVVEEELDWALSRAESFSARIAATAKALCHERLADFFASIGRNLSRADDALGKMLEVWENASEEERALIPQYRVGAALWKRAMIADAQSRAQDANRYKREAVDHLIKSLDQDDAFSARVPLLVVILNSLFSSEDPESIEFAATRFHTLNARREFRKRLEENQGLPLLELYLAAAQDAEDRLNDCEEVYRLYDKMAPLLKTALVDARRRRLTTGKRSFSASESLANRAFLFQLRFFGRCGAMERAMQCARLGREFFCATEDAEETRDFVKRLYRSAESQETELTEEDGNDEEKASAADVVAALRVVVGFNDDEDSEDEEPQASGAKHDAANDASRVEERRRFFRAFYSVAELKSLCVLRRFDEARALAQDCKSEFDELLQRLGWKDRFEALEHRASFFEASKGRLARVVAAARARLRRKSFLAKGESRQLEYNLAASVAVCRAQLSSLDKSPVERAAILRRAAQEATTAALEDGFICNSGELYYDLARISLDDGDFDAVARYASLAIAESKIDGVEDGVGLALQRFDAIKLLAEALVARGRRGDLRRAERLLTPTIDECEKFMRETHFSARAVLAELLVVAAELARKMNRRDDARRLVVSAASLRAECEKLKIGSWEPTTTKLYEKLLAEASLQ